MTDIPPNESDFWNWSENGATLNVEAVIQNTIRNMRRLEEKATLRVVVDYLRDSGYIVIEPEDEA